MKTKIQFGAHAPITIQKKRADAKSARKAVVEDGIESNTFTTYSHETSFENIKTNVNVTRVKIDDTHTVGVAKGAILAGVPITAPTNDAAATEQAMKKRCDFKPQMQDIGPFKTWT